MYLLLTYYIATTTAEDAKRLRRVAKACEGYGQRVQNSVFELKVDAGTRRQLEARLLKIIDLKHDSLRVYALGKDRSVTHYGAKPGYDLERALIAWQQESRRAFRLRRPFCFRLPFPALARRDAVGGAASRQLLS